MDEWLDRFGWMNRLMGGWIGLDEWMTSLMGEG